MFRLSNVSVESPQATGCLDSFCPASYPLGGLVHADLDAPLFVNRAQLPCFPNRTSLLRHAHAAQAFFARAPRVARALQTARPPQRAAPRRARSRAHARAQLADGKEGLGLLKLHNKMASSIEVAGGAGAIYFSFHDAPHYSLSNPIAGDVIDAVKADRGFAPPVRDQTSQCAGCWAFSSAAAFSALAPTMA